MTESESAVKHGTVETSGVHPEAIIHDTAEVHTTARIGTRTRIWHQVQVGEGVSVGADCVLGKSVYVASAAVIGDRAATRPSNRAAADAGCVPAARTAAVTCPTRVLSWACGTAAPADVKVT